MPVTVSQWFSCIIYICFFMYTFTLRYTFTFTSTSHSRQMLHYTVYSLHSKTITLCCITLHDITTWQPCVASHYIALHHTKSHYIASRHNTSITVHVTLQTVYIHTTCYTACYTAFYITLIHCILQCQCRCHVPLVHLGFFVGETRIK